MMIKMKKTLSFSLAALLCAVALTACGTDSNTSKEVTEQKQEQAQEQKKEEIKYPTKPINVIVSYSAGGGTDVGARILLPYVEKELGVPLNVINKPGGGGWVGWTDLLKAEPDGYTIGYLNTPNLMSGYLDPQFNRKDNLESFEFIANHVVDYGALAVNPSETRFKDIKELIEYAKQNEVTATTTGAGSDDHMALLKINKAFGTKFVPVHTKGAADGKAAVMGGHVDVYAANVGEVTIPVNNGEIKVLAVMAPERTEFLPDVPTLEEAGFAGVESYSARGIGAPKGIDPQILEKISNAFEKAVQDPEQVKKMADLGLQVKFLKGQYYYQFAKSDEKSVLEISDLLGWKK